MIEKINDLKALTQKLTDSKILLVGDIMLDTFVYGSVSRISPEGPIPVLKVDKEREMLGGAGNVLANAHSLGCHAEMISVIGDDTAGQKIAHQVGDLGSSPQGLVTDDDRPTVRKTRYLAQNQQLLRVDQERVVDISIKTQNEIYDYAASMIGSMDAVVLSDYGKGVLTADLVKRLIQLAKKNKKPVIVDPKVKDFSLYKGATVVTPNKKELSEATNGMAVDTDQDIEATAQWLMKQSGIDCVIATRSEDGISVISKKEKPIHIPTQALEVYDVSGAGDTVVAVIAAGLAVGASYHDIAALANIAGGLVVAKVGTASIDKEEMIQALDEQEDHAGEYIAPLMDASKARDQIQKWQAKGLKVGFTNGCFDIVHYGHVHYLNNARERCDKLVVGLNHDQSVRILKGETRPINDEVARATVIGGLGIVDMVVLFGAIEEGADNTPSEILGVLQPDVLMKGGDYTVDQLPEAKVVLGYGGQVDIMPLYEGYSTTNIIEKSKKEEAA